MAAEAQGYKGLENLAMGGVRCLPRAAVGVDEREREDKTK